MGIFCYMLISHSQGIIMGVETTTHMLLGAIIGWAILSPLAKHQGWAPGPVNDWESGSKGWIIWISLAIMLVDAVVSLAYLALRPLLGDRINHLFKAVRERFCENSAVAWLRHGADRYLPLPSQDQDCNVASGATEEEEEEDEEEDTEIASVATEDDADADAPMEQRIDNRTVSVGFVMSVLICIFAIYVVFGDLVPLYATTLAVFMALVLSIMGVRALGETDLNPVSGISKLAQLFFALIIPQSNKSSVLINLVAGAVVSSFFSPFETGRARETNLWPASSQKL